MEGCVTYYRSSEGDTADVIAWRFYGRQNNGIVEAVLQANPGLADRGPILPEGVRVALPDVAPDDSTASVRLWG